MSNKNLTIGIAVAVLIAIGAYFFPQMKAVPSQLFGSTACASITCLSGGLRLVTDAGGDFEADVASVFAGTVKIGTSGTAQVNQVVTTCSMIANVSIAASSTGYAFCTGVTGVTSADSVIASFSTSTSVFLNTDSWEVITAKASTTAGAIDFTIYNSIGRTAVPSAVSQIGSTTVIRAGH